MLAKGGNMLNTNNRLHKKCSKIGQLAERKSYTKKSDIAILIGNAIDHLDSALYIFLASIIAPLFFPEHDKIVQLILTYSVLASSIITRPIGTIIFSNIAQKFTPLTSLSIAILGVSICLILTGLLPSYQQIGAFAPFLLVVIRSIKGICSSGEVAIAKFFIMEDKNLKKAFKSSYWYQTFTMFGGVVASLISGFIISLEGTESSNIAPWRVCFIALGICSMLIYFLTFPQKSIFNFEKPIVNKELKSQISQIFGYKKLILQITLVNSVSNLTYSVAFIVINNIAPLVSQVSTQSMMALNSILLALDMVMIPVFGKLLKAYDYAKIMFYACLILVLSLLPLWLSIQNASLPYIIFVRCWIVLWGVVFLCPINLWSQNFITKNPKVTTKSEIYLINGIGSALASSTVGKLTPTITLSLWYFTGSLVPIGIYMTIILAACAFLIYSANFSN